MSVRVKICGMNSAAAMDAAASARVDWVGFVAFPRSPRFVTPEEAAMLAARAPGGPRRVVLFVEPEDDWVAAFLARVRAEALQVYAGEERVAALRRRFGVPVWRSVGVTGRGDLPARTEADALVIEPRPPAGAERPGGNALALDWPMLSGWTAPVPWLLAGGLTPGNVGRAIAGSGARAVDVSSGVESAPGTKDPARIAEFVRSVRAAG
jgi:phosphoribosylanthranilate isomerase